MEFTFPVVIGLNGGHGDGGDAEVTIDISEAEYKLLQASQEEYLSCDKLLDDVYQRADAAFREQQMDFIDEDFLAEIAEFNGKDVNDLDEEEIWEGFCDRYSYRILIPNDEFDEEDENDE